jgi:hypothetical protein
MHSTSYIAPCQSIIYDYLVSPGLLEGVRYRDLAHS